MVIMYMLVVSPCCKGFKKSSVGVSNVQRERDRSISCAGIYCIDLSETFCTYNGDYIDMVIAGSFRVSLVIEIGSTKDFNKMPWYFYDKKAY